MQIHTFILYSEWVFIHDFVTGRTDRLEITDSLSYAGISHFGTLFNRKKLYSLISSSMSISLWQI